VGQAANNALEAVADPTRLRIMRHLAASESASIGELAQSTGVHANTVRSHTAALERAGVLARERAVPKGRGRPPLRFRLRDDTPPPGADAHGLAAVLAAALGRPRGKRTLGRLRSLGAAWGRDRAGGDRELVDGLARLGFRARVEGDRLELFACPCPLVAPAHPETICHVALGAVNGILADSGRCVEAGAHDPQRRRCVLTLGARPQLTESPSN
jgi:predicted ArsR family transcriptional regulator